MKDKFKPISTFPNNFYGKVLVVEADNKYNKLPFIAWLGHDQNIDPDEKNTPEWLTGDGDGWSTGYYFTPCKPTHWMYLPEFNEDEQ